MTIEEEKLKELSKLISEKNREMTKEESEFILARLEKVKNKITIVQALLMVNAIMLPIVVIFVVLYYKSNLSTWNRFLEMFGFVPFAIIANAITISGIKFRDNTYKELLLHKLIIVREAVFIERTVGSASGQKVNLYIKKNGYMIRETYRTYDMLNFKKGEIVLLREGKTNILYPSPKGNYLHDD